MSISYSFWLAPEHSWFSVTEHFAVQFRDPFLISIEVSYAQASGSSIHSLLRDRQYCVFRLQGAERFWTETNRFQ